MIGTAKGPARTLSSSPRFQRVMREGDESSAGGAGLISALGRARRRPHRRVLINPSTKLTSYCFGSVLPSSDRTSTASRAQAIAASS
jgi:hypothetical protein